MSTAEVIVYRTPYCGYCRLAAALLDKKGVPYREVDVGQDAQLRTWLREETGSRTVPQIFINGQPVGGFTELAALDRSGKLDTLLGSAPTSA